MDKRFRPYNLDQRLLLPPDMRDWLPERHLALFILDVVATLDLSAIFADYGPGRRGRPPYHPQMMVALLLYAYCTGKPSSRKIERATYEDVAYRVLAGDQHPDHDTIATFRKRHLEALAGLFLQILLLCREAGLVKLGHVSLDGTKVKANASKHKAMSYKRMCETEKRLEEEVKRLLAGADAADQAEDEAFGKGVRGDDLPAELARRESRLSKIREAKAALEQQARDKATEKAEIQRQKIEARASKEAEIGKKMGGRPPKEPEDPNEAVPEPKAQRNFTDPESRIMLDGASKGFEQAYNAQAVVDDEAQIVVASGVTQETNDKKQLKPMVEKVESNLGELPEKLSADAGHYSDDNVTDPDLEQVDLYIPPSRQKHGKTPVDTTEPLPADAPPIEKMRHKLRTPEGRAVYKERKQIVEPIFGQIKEVRGFRRFSFRGLVAVAREWDLICLTHNLLKLFRAGLRLQVA
jgi:transposase